MLLLVTFNAQLPNVQVTPAGTMTPAGFVPKETLATIRSTKIFERSVSAAAIASATSEIPASPTFFTLASANAPLVGFVLSPALIIIKLSFDAPITSSSVCSTAPLMTDQGAEATQAALNLPLGLTTASTLAVAEGTLNAFPAYPDLSAPPTFKI